MKKLFKSRKNNVIILAGVVVVIALLSIPVVVNALTDINTNNNSASDWNGVSVFQYDPAGDLNTSCTGANGTVDIVESYVAYGPSTAAQPEWIYFRIRTASANAVSTDYYLASAYLDCAPDGMDIKDLNAMYLGFDDVIFFGDGLYPNPNNVGSYGNPPSPQGERPADALDTVEWSVDYATFSQNPSYGTPRDPNCTPGTVAKIRFSTIKINSSNQYVCTFDETTWDLSVDMDEFEKSAPANGATEVPLSPNLSWSDSGNGYEYEYCYDTTDDDACSTWINNGTNTSVSLSSLAPDTYYWQVRAVYLGAYKYADGGAKSFWSFTTVNANPDDTPTPTATSTSTSTATATATSTSTQPATSTSTATFTPTFTATSSPSPTPTDTPTMTATWTPTATNTETPTPTLTPEPTEYLLYAPILIKEDGE